MRTAITLAKTHSGEWKLLATPDDSLIEQKADFRGMRASRSHKDLSTVIYQESDGSRETIRFITPEQEKKQQEQHEKDVAEMQKSSDEAKAALATKAQKEQREAANQAHAKATTEADKNQAPARKQK